MSQNTTNYNLKKLELTDPADITALNTNWDSLDSTLKRLEDNNAIPNADITNIVTYGTRTGG